MIKSTFYLNRLIIAAVAPLIIAAVLMIFNHTEFNWKAFTLLILLPTILSILLLIVQLKRNANTLNDVIEHNILFKAISLF